MGSEVTLQDLLAVGSDVKRYVGERLDAVEKLNDERFGGITKRLDKLNGSVARHDRELASHGENLKGLNHEVYDHRATTPAEATVRAFAWRDAKMIGIAFGAMGMVVEGLHQAGALIYALLTKGH